MVEFVEINGAQLAYRICGPEDAPLIITLHGGRGMGNHQSDFKAFSPLADSYRVLSFDYRGHGQSSRTKPYTFDQIVDDIDGMRAHFVGPKEKVIILGGSFGGFLAQQYAIKYASHVSHLILRGTAPSYHHEEGAIKTLEQRLSKAPSFSIEMLKDKVFGAFDSDLEFRMVHLAMSPLYSESFDPNAALQSCLNNVYNAESHSKAYPSIWREDLHKITAKTLVVVGDKDWICPPAKEINDAELFVVENANHSVHVEKNELVLKKIRSHLEQ
ncbi:hypothetical protein G7054_g13963 [Neopestalotiopsis clavispora]|nr:hypothetical protein G7054_g13963 [Neopestalotiopsis clavispora]